MSRNEFSLPLPLRVTILGIALVALLSGIWAGLWRVGWMVPVPDMQFPAVHGPLMISGFLGTLISLERAVALKKGWPFSAPVLTGFGAVVLIAGNQSGLGYISFILGSAMLSFVFFYLYRKDPELHFIIMGLGANLWLVGNILWFRGYAIPQVVHWWAGFLVLTIAGERLELSRVLQLKKAVIQTFIAITLFYIITLFLSVIWFNSGMRLIGLALIGLVIWLFKNDLATRSVRQGGLSRYMAVAMISGYLWLFFAGIALLIVGGVTRGVLYDAILHTVFVGFVFSMIFGHAPVIFPIVLKLKVAFRHSFYVHLLLLHISLGIRLTGDLMANDPVRMWGSLLNGIAILLFLYNTVTSVLDTALSSRKSLSRRT